MMRWVVLCIAIRSTEPISCVLTVIIGKVRLDTLVPDTSEILLLVKASVAPNAVVQHVLLHDCVLLEF